MSVKVKVEVLEGSVIVAVSQLSRDCTVEVKFGDATFRIRDRGLYRFDILPAVEQLAARIPRAGTSGFARTGAASSGGTEWPL